MIIISHACLEPRLLRPQTKKSSLTTLGLLSDSHGRTDSAEAAVQLLIENGADVLIHLGDVGSTGVIDTLAAVNPKTGRPIEVHMVFGNTDWDARELGRYARDLGHHVHEPAGDMEIDGFRVAFTHGHLNKVMHHLIASEPDYLLHGHTHVLDDHNEGLTRVINPGALFRASRYTAALLEPATGELRVLEIASVPG